MAPLHGSTEPRVKNSGVSPAGVDQQVNAALWIQSFHPFFVTLSPDNSFIV